MQTQTTENGAACGQSRSTAGLGRMTFEAHKDATAEDCEAVAKLLTELAGEARKGNLRAFEEFWVEGGTEEGDAKVAFIREMMAMRFYHREEAVRSNCEVTGLAPGKDEQNA